MTGRRWIRFLLAAAILLVAAHLMDRWAYAALGYPPGNDRDWGRMLRVLGYAPTWGLAAIALWLEGRGQPAPNRSADSAWDIVVAVAVGGLLAELVKLLVRRYRPDPTGEYRFRPFSDHPWSSRDLGMPSSHATVAFAGTAALSRRFPRAGPVLFGLAVGCGLTRLMARAHFLSDVVAGAVLGIGVGNWNWRPRRRISDAA